jgi:outer membrane protein TolC
VSWRIFDAGRIMANVRLQRAGTEEAELSYRNTILTALREVEDALVKYATEQNRRNQLNEELSQNRRALDLARDRYNRGLADFLSVLDAEKNALSTEDLFAQSSVSVSTNLVALYGNNPATLHRAGMTFKVGRLIEGISLACMPLPAQNYFYPGSGSYTI